jgi:hypothetical protein
VLIDIVKNKLFLNYKNIDLKGLKCVKDKIVLLIYLYHYFVQDHLVFETQREIADYIHDEFLKRREYDVPDAKIE